MMDIRNMDSIWVEDEQSSKFHLNDPNLKILNSQVPILSSKENIELPPLPPTSFFTHTLSSDDVGAATKNNKFLSMFKKLGISSNTMNHSNNNDQPKTEIRRVKKKISTPFGFNHISHIDNQAGGAITVNQLSEMALKEEPESLTDATGPDVSKSNRTSTSAKAFCTSPQIKPIPSTTVSTKHIPRSVSNATTLSRASSSQLFTRSGSISTMATTISSKTHSKKNSTSIIGTSHNTTSSTNSHINHQHQNSTSSIENLKKLEKNQITKQCSIDYTSDFTFPQKKTDLNNWATPDLQSAVRQSWIYEDLSPHSPLRPKKAARRANSISGSPSYSPYRSDINLFQNEVETTFNKSSNLNEIINSIDDFTKFFKATEQDEDVEEEDEEDSFYGTIASLRAAKFSRLSRLENFYQHDPRYLSFIEEFQKVKTNSVDLSSNYTKSTSPDLKEIAQVPEILEFDSDEEEESTPRQHHISTLLPSMIS